MTRATHCCERIEGNSRYLASLAWLIAIAPIALALLPVWLLYETAVAEHRSRLSELARERARAIGAMENAGFRGPAERSLQVLMAAFTRLDEASLGLGRTAEIGLAQVTGRSIDFLLSGPQGDVASGEVIPLSGGFAEPVRRALSGASGTAIALDYRGAKVLAAYEPILFRGLSLGLVAKVDLSALRAPYEKAAAISVLVAGLLSVLGVILLLRVSREILNHERGQRQFRDLLLESAPDAIIIVDSAGHIVMANPQAEQLFGYDHGELSGRTIEMLVPEGRRARHLTLRDDYMTDSRRRSMSQSKGLCGRRKDGTDVPVEISLGPIDTVEGRYYAAAIRDVTERSLAEATIERMALEYPLTQLPNRAQFRRRLEEAVERADRSGNHLSLLLLDLDGFKQVNDSHGHPIGDELLVQVAGRLVECARGSDTVARLGGDEFAVIATNLRTPEGATKLAEKLVRSLNSPFSLEGRTVNVGVSVGVTVYPGQTDNSEQLLANADLALYKAKEQGSTKFETYDDSMDASFRARQALESALRETLRSNQFHLVYQPKFAIATGEIIGAEALLRWNNPERGAVPPGEFIPLAESTGLIVPISEWVLRTVCAQIREWRDAGFRKLCLAINVSPMHFKQTGFADEVTSVLQANGLNPDRLELEITETTAMEAGENIKMILDALRWIGVGISIDGFGTGYSSLIRLKEFPVDRLKIDRSFVRDVVTDRNDATISTAVIQLGHSLNKKVVAEGVETAGQFNFLAEQGCDEVQGYLFSRPLKPAAFEQLLMSYCPVSLLDRSNTEGPLASRRDDLGGDKAVA